MKRAAGSLRTGILLAVLSPFATAGYAQSALLPAAQSPPPAPSCVAGDIGCPATPETRTMRTVRPQEVPSGFGQAIRTIGHDFAAFPSAKTVTWLGASAGVALVGTAGDRALVHHLDGKRWSVFRAGADMGSAPVHAGLALGTFVAGRLSGSTEVSALGFQLIRANLMTQALTHGLKVTTHRLRPDGTGLSFPSGHSATSFAAATVLQRRYGWKAGVPAYALASYVAASRVNDRRHFASDVIFGAGLGIAVGLTVTRDMPGGGSIVPVMTRGGVGAVWTKTW